MSLPGKRNNCLTLREKVDVINAIDSGTTRQKIMSEYRLPPSTLSCIIRQRDRLLQKVGQGSVSPSSKRIRPVESPELEEKMKEFVSECRRDGVALSGKLMLSKAREYAQDLGLSNFRASNGWLYNFKNRQGLCAKKNKLIIDLQKNDRNIKAKRSEETDASASLSNVSEHTNNTKVKHDPLDDEVLVTVDEPYLERDRLKLEAFDTETDDGQNDDTEITMDFVNAKDFASTLEFDGVSVTKASIPEAVNAGGGGIEDEFSCFGRYIAQALRSMPARMSVLARSELQTTLARVQMKCLKREREH